MYAFLQTTYKLKPFYGARVCFYGFSNEETKHMQEVLESNGGSITKIDDPLCTHVVSLRFFFKNYYNYYYY